MHSFNKGQDLDFIVATHEDDAGALARISAISSSFPRAHIIVVDSSGEQYRDGARLADIIASLGNQASYVRCTKACRYTCYQHALSQLTGRYVAFRHNGQIIDETRTARGFAQAIHADLLITHPGQTVAGLAENTQPLQAVVFKREFVEQQQPFSDPLTFNEQDFIASVLQSAHCQTGGEAMAAA
ncbi:hypothetical protein IT774_02585 [Salinimonas marina]|uniref:Uncharacterized protein n=1 Tax=Salinimonas marina TaxID=2785918 RepID=A0A7S9HDE6_9ALTE|nr:hypothetical protein [Salinimonas marina]QPG06125.1 hypothetical protein IT774_02585 [Salinimonas marina]